MDKEFRKITSLKIFNQIKKESILFEANPDIIHQWNSVYSNPKGIFLTNAHMGHYSGLLHLGKEALASEFMSFYVMPRMYNFLKNNGP